MRLLDFSYLTYENLGTHLDDIMASEQLFPEDIRETPEGYADALGHDKAIGLIASLRGVYVGNILGVSPSDEMSEILRLHEVETVRAGLIYIYNVATMPEFHSKGFGRELLAVFLNKAHEAGFERVGGHFRNNASLKNFVNFGGRQMGVFDNWFDTGESYVYCELPLDDSAIKTEGEAAAIEAAFRSCRKEFCRARFL